MTFPQESFLHKPVVFGSCRFTEISSHDYESKDRSLRDRTTHFSGHRTRDSASVSMSFDETRTELAENDDAHKQAINAGAQGLRSTRNEMMERIDFNESVTFHLLCQLRKETSEGFGVVQSQLGVVQSQLGVVQSQIGVVQSQMGAMQSQITGQASLAWNAVSRLR